MEDEALTRLRAMCLALPEVTERLSHGEPTWFIRGKTTFATFAEQHHDDRVACWLAAPPGSQQALVASDPTRFFVPRYVGHRGWVGVRLDVADVDWVELGELVVEAYRAVAPKRLVARLDAADPTRSRSRRGRLLAVHEVRIAGPDDAVEAGRVLAAGFVDDPVMCWVFEERGRARKLDALFGFLATEVVVGLGATYLTTGCCGAWTPPGAPEWTEERSTRFVTAMAAVATVEDLERLGVLDDTMQAHHPHEPLWYLGAIATEPDRRGEGRGGAVLATSLAAVDASGLPAYLESTNPRNVPLYQRHGFEVTGTIDLPGGPALTPMWRPGRSG